MHTVYDNTTGMLLGLLCCPDHLLDTNESQLPVWQSLTRYSGNFDGSYYYYHFETNMILPRPKNPAVISSLTLNPDGLDVVVISGLPVPCTLTVEGSSYEVTDSEFEFTADMPGAYKITAEAFPYLPLEWEVTAV